MKKVKLLISLILILIITSTGCKGTSSANSDDSLKNSSAQNSDYSAQADAKEISNKSDNNGDAVLDDDDASADDGDEVSAGNTNGDASDNDSSDANGGNDANSGSNANGGSDKPNASSNDANSGASNESTVVELESNGDAGNAVTIEQLGSNRTGSMLRVLTPKATGQIVKGNSYISIDVSNAGEGYIIATYKGTNAKTKIQVKQGNNQTYNYDAPNAPIVIPLVFGSGTYQITCAENISQNQYAVVYSENLDFTVTNALGPFLYPNVYVNFNGDSISVVKANELCSKTASDIEAVETVYHYIMKNFTYDYDKAASVENGTLSKGYIPKVDEFFQTGKGICFDYAVAMVSMLRSQNIPARLEIGYAKDAYHAWISVYIKDVGWIDDIIRFDGKNWTLMDPTFASGDYSKKTKKFISDKSNYAVKYIY